MVSVDGKRALPRSDRTSRPYRTMDIWALSCLHKIYHVILWHPRGASSSSSSSSNCLHFLVDLFMEFLILRWPCRSWQWRGAPSVRKGFSLSLEAVPSFIMPQCSCTSGSSRLRWSRWSSGATSTSASTGSAFTSTRPSPPCASQITRHSPVSISLEGAIWRSTRSPLTRWRSCSSGSENISAFLWFSQLLKRFPASHDDIFASWWG